MIPSGFLPADIFHFFTADKQGEEVLSVNEQAIAKTYGAKRLTDFCTGRYCLRKCTEAYGYSGDLLIGERGMPLLPGGITASLSHSKNLCGAIAGTKDTYRSLGLDIETAGRVNKDMWYLLFTSSEVNFLRKLPDEEQKVTAAAFFSMKEAFYKMQYPLSGIYLDFPEVEVTVTNDRYGITTMRDVGNAFAKGQTVQGSMIHHLGEVITFCSLPAR